MHVLKKWYRPFAQAGLFTNSCLSHNHVQAHWTCQLRRRSQCNGIRTACRFHVYEESGTSFRTERHTSSWTRGHKKSGNYLTKVDIFNVMATEDAFVSVAGFDILPWSISGLESCIVVRKEDLQVAFDMGYAFREAVKCSHVLISHGHIDHVAGIVGHASKRGLYSMKPATYYTLPHLVAPLQDVHAAFAAAHGDRENFAPWKLAPVDEEAVIKLGGAWHARPFPTQHRVPSQGYIIYHTTKKLKPEFKGVPGPDIGELVRQGVEVNQITTLPQVAYTGDTTFDLFLNPPTEDLLKVKLLITEATYIDKDVDRDGKPSKEKARERGHCHLIEFIENADIFKHVENILFVHFSDKYPVKYIHKMVNEIVPEEMQSKIHLGIQLKKRNEADSAS